MSCLLPFYLSARKILRDSLADKKIPTESSEKDIPTNRALTIQNGAIMDKVSTVRAHKQRLVVVESISQWWKER